MTCYTAINAKIKAMKAKLLTQSDYQELCGGKNFSYEPRDDLKKISSYLNKTNRDFIQKPWDGLQVNEILRGIATLDKSDGKSLKHVYGTETDLRNILFLYRLKRFYKIGGNAVFPFLIPFNHKLKPPEIAKLAQAKDLNEFVKLVSIGVYGEIFNKLSDFARGEQILSNAVRTQYKKEGRNENLSVVCGYLYAKKLETKNLRAIETGLKNGLPPGEIFSLLSV